MMNRPSLIVAVAALAAVWASGQNSNSAKPVPKPAANSAAVHHPDLSGLWLYSVDLPPTVLKKESNGTVIVKTIDQSGRRPAAAPVSGALPFTEAPSYKPEFQAKVKDLFDHESKTDPVFYCGRPGVPRIGPPRKIVQMPKETIFLYEDASGNPYRVIPIDGRPHRTDANPTTYGDSIGRWDGNVFVVDVTSISDDTWFGEGGYFHSDAMHVIERYWRDGANLVYQATVEDPKVLTVPWTMAPRVVKPSTEVLEEAPPCIETDASRLVNNDHHGQR